MSSTAPIKAERALIHLFSMINSNEALVRDHRSGVQRYVLSRVNDADLAETVTHDCFLRAYESRDEFREECSIRTWLIAIATNLIRDYTRTKRFRF